MIGLSAIQTALYAKLTGDVTLMGLVAGVFDRAPAGQAFPYITLGDVEATDASTFGRLVESNTVNVHVWTKDSATATGKKACQLIMNRLDLVLNRQPLTVSGFTFVSCLREFWTITDDPDEFILHGVIRFRVIVTE